MLVVAVVVEVRPDGVAEEASAEDAEEGLVEGSVEVVAVAVASEAAGVDQEEHHGGGAASVVAVVEVVDAGRTVHNVYSYAAISFPSHFMAQMPPGGNDVTNL